MAAGLSDLLNSLHGCCRSHDSADSSSVQADGQRALDFIGSIASVCLEDVAIKDADLACSQIFSEKIGLIIVLRNTIDIDEFQESRVAILDFLEKLSAKYGASVLPHAVEIKKVCVSLFVREKSAKVKNSTLSLLIEVLRLSSGSNYTKDMDIEKLIKKFMMELMKSPSKSPPSVRGGLFHLLGFITEIYPDLMLTYAQTLLEIYVNNLKQEMTSKTKKPEMTIITGCLEGLNCLLVNFTHSADEGGQYAFDIYTYMRKALDKNISYARYETPKAALKLLSRHACQFNQYLMKEYEVSDVFLSPLEKLVVLMIENHPKLHKKIHFHCFLAVCKIYLTLTHKGAVLQGFISRTVFQGLIRTCSHQISYDDGEPSEAVNRDEQMTDFSQSRISYKDYLNFWKTLLELATIKELSQLGFTMSERNMLASSIYDHLIESVLKILSRLNLRSTKADDDDVMVEVIGGSDNISTDPIFGLQATKPKDFVVFINLVDFCRDLLLVKFAKKSNSELFRCWAYKFGREVILICTQCPFVSGLYKLMTICFQLCSRIAYFKGLVELRSPGDTANVIKEESESMEFSVSMEVDDQKAPTASQKEACFGLFSKFSKEVIVQMKQYRDDLLASCLFMIMELPDEILYRQLHLVVPVLQRSLTIGRSYLPLAKAALRTLDHWCNVIPSELMWPHYKHLLPLLDAYLKSTQDQIGSESGVDTISIVSSRSKNTGSRRNKISIKVLKESTSAVSDLGEVKSQCVDLLGRLGGAINNFLVTGMSKTDLSKLAVAWDMNSHLKYYLPFSDLKPSIYFDPLLPRVVELATTSSDRRTKVVACELLHSLVLYMVGRGAQATVTTGSTGGEDLRHSMAPLYKKVFPAILQLARDVEQVSRQLFEPLMTQLIHWFTSRAMSQSQDCMVLLDSILESLVNVEDSSLRDFSGTCLREFLKWSIKQSTKEQTEKGPFSIKAMLKRLYSYARHQSSAKRLGAALGFNSIYTIFREESSLVDMFVLEILVVYVECLALAHTDDKSLGTQEQCRQVLVHLERIIKVKSQLLNKPSKNRRNPKRWKETPDLATAIDWLVQQCGRPQTKCRHSCMYLIFELVLCLPGVKIPKDYFDQKLKKVDGLSYFIKSFEQESYKRTIGTKSGIAGRPCLDGTSSLKAAIEWFDLVLASLDCYTWIFGKDLLNPTVVFGSQSGSVLFGVLAYFLRDVAGDDLETTSTKWKLKTEPVLFTPREREEYNRSKCTLIVRLINFLTILFSRYAKESEQVIPSSFFSKHLWDIVLLCIIEPVTLGFNMAELEVMTKLPEETSSFLKSLSRLPRLASNFKIAVGEKMTDRSLADMKSLFSKAFDDSSADHSTLCCFVSGYKQLHVNGYLTEAATKSSLSISFLNLVYNGMVTSKDGQEVTATLSPSSVELAKELLSLAFVLDPNCDKLLKLLLDRNLVHLDGFVDSTADRGRLFYTKFKMEIDCHLVTHASSSIPLLVSHARDSWNVVGKIMTGMLDAACHDTQLRHKHGSKLIGVIFDEWDNMNVWWKGDFSTLETKSLILTLLTKVIIVDPSILNDSDQTRKALASIVNMYCLLLTDRQTSLADKTRALDLLMFFARLTNPLHTSLLNTGKPPNCYSIAPLIQALLILRTSLDSLTADNFPIKSTEYAAGSPKYNDYISALDKLLLGMEMSGNSMLLEQILTILCREDRHVHEDAIQTSLARFMKRLPVEQQKSTLEVPFQYFKNMNQLNADQRRAAFDRVLLTLLKSSKTQAFIEFFVGHLPEVLSILEEKYVKVSEASLQGQLTNKICCFELVELMYWRILKDGSSGSADQDLKGKEIKQKLARIANDVKFEDVRGETVLLELRRQLHCAAYNALIAVISSTQTDPKFYNAFLFTESPNKGQFLWENLLDLTRKYEFPIETENSDEKRKKYHSIRSNARQHSRQQSEDSEFNSMPASVQYMASEYLADSSLNSDISQFDFAGSVAFVSKSTSPGGTQHGQRSSSNTLQSSGDVSSLDLVDDLSFELETDPLNLHECMVPLIMLLKHMQQNITKKETSDADKETMPSWMANMNKKMSTSYCPLNVKLFLAKVIVNIDEIFKPFAKFWLEPLVSVASDAGLMGEDVNNRSLVNDIVVTLLSWHTVARPQNTSTDRAMVSHLVQCLMKHCHHDNRQVLRNNLEVLKTLFEVWRDCIDVPTKVLYDNFTDTDPKSKRNATGVQMVGVVVANRLLPYRPDQGVDTRQRFYHMLAKNLTNESKAVYAATAEVVGMTMKLMEDVEKSESDAEFHEQLMDNIAKLLSGIKEDRFIYCVHRIQLHHPVISQKFRAKILFILPRVYGIFKTQCLEILQKIADQTMFVELKAKGFLDLLPFRDENIQMAALNTVHALLQYLKLDDLLTLLPLLSEFLSHSSTECRAVMYNIFMWIYDHYKNEDSDVYNAAVAKARDVLLQGLSDKDETNRVSVHNFWSHETRLPSGTFERLVFLMEAMYSPETEDQYLSYTTNFMMELTSKSLDFNREMFDQPLSECKFEDYKVRSGWQDRHSVMTPLFVETQASSTQLSFGDANESGQLRVTQAMASFAPTQAGDAKGPYNWLTQNSLDMTFGGTLSMSRASSSEAQSSLLFTIGSNRPKRPMQTLRPVESDHGQRRLGEGSDKSEDAQQAGDILRLRRRFVKSRGETEKLFFAKVATRKNRERERLQEIQKQRREHQVTMYRKYRIGDLPDIQIKHSYIIAPLQGLAQRDSTTARLLFRSLFKGIFEEIEKEKTGTELQGICSKISQSIDNMLRNSVHYVPPFIGSILEIVLESKGRLKLDPSYVSQSCIVSSMQPLGILLLEETAIQSSTRDTEPLAKRARTSSSHAMQPEDVNNWIEIVRLYKSLGEYDVVHGIFTSHLSRANTLTKEAIEQEMRRDFASAAKLYSKGLQLDSQQINPPSDLEMDCWEENRLMCYDRLGQWDKLEEACHSRLNIKTSDEAALDSVWNDVTDQETFLPFMLRSKLKLLLDGATNQQSLLSFIDRAMKVPERRSFLEMSFGTELALLYIWQDMYELAKSYADKAQDVFYQDWSSLNDLMSHSRLEKLQRLQKLVELKEFLGFMKMHADFRSRLPAKSLSDKWTARMPDSFLDSVEIWDDIVSNRCLYLDHIGSRMNDNFGDDVGDRFREVKVKFRLDQVQGAICQNNFNLALKLLRVTRKDGGSNVDWTHAFARTHHKRCRLSWVPMNKKIKALSGVKDQLEKVGSKQESSSKTHNMLLGETYRLVADLVCKDPERKAVSDEETRTNLASIAGCKVDSQAELIISLVEKGFHHLKLAADGSFETNSDLSNLKDSDDCLLALYKFCDQYLRSSDDDPDSEFSQCPSFSSFSNTAITALLAAMKQGSRQARQLFPRLLQIISSNKPEISNLFVTESAKVPCWMFLGWISQMTAILDKPESPAVHLLLKTIADEFPESLVYPFMVSRDGYQFIVGAEKKNKAFCDELQKVLSKNPLIGKLVVELEHFDQPNIVFKEWCSDVDQLLKSGNPDVSRLQEMFNQMSRKLIGKDSQSELFGDDGSLSGPYWVKFQKQFGPKLEKMCASMKSWTSKGAAGDKARKEFQSQARALLEEMNKLCVGPLKPPVTLKEYSTWLADFQSNLYDEEIEIPGQYTGDEKPMPEYHTKVSSFQESILVMSSIRKPKRLIIRGNDEKDYKFLVKCGEDLRQDQRIESLFSLMNELFDHDAACRQHGLRIRTYQVIPMTPRLGIIEWMDKTIPLKDQILGMMTDTEKSLYTSNKGPSTDHQKFIGSSPQQYYEAYQKKSRSDTVTAFRRREQLVPSDLLQRAYKKMSSSAEAYFRLRTNFATTHAQICVCHYILGIGDRHQSNYMIDLETGSMVGIDFGHAFGSATQFLPIPELVPFRLTRQIVSLMLPMKEKGLMERIMIHTLFALKENSQLLLTTMDVFIKEPSLDWKQFSEKQKKQMQDPTALADAEVDAAWYPRQKIGVARQKLEGGNCTHIMRSELQLGHGKAPHCRYFEKVLMGEKGSDVRASLPETNLTVDQQVTCLIDLATDPNILGRFWVGWEPWM